jgi:20S proteasome subunit beta 1
MVRQAVSLGGSGSTYIWGYLDNNFRPNMTKQECLDFVLKGLFIKINLNYFYSIFFRYNIGYNS